MRVGLGSRVVAGAAGALVLLVLPQRVEEFRMGVGRSGS